MLVPSISISFPRKFYRFNVTRFLLALILGTFAACSHEHASVQIDSSTPAAPCSTSTPKAAFAGATEAEQIRTECIQGRRLICGKVLKVMPDGLVIDSGYTDLVRPPLTESWLIPSTVVANRNSTAIELNNPGTPCFGQIFLTDLPKRPKAKNFDYVVIMAYPAGQFVYEPAPNIKKQSADFPPEWILL